MGGRPHPISRQLFRSNHAFPSTPGALRVPYNFQTDGITCRIDLFILRRGRQYTFFQFVGTQKAFDAMNKELVKIVNDADINAAGGK